MNCRNSLCDRMLKLLIMIKCGRECMKHLTDLFCTMEFEVWIIAQGVYDSCYLQSE